MARYQRTLVWQVAFLAFILFAIFGRITGEPLNDHDEEMDDVPDIVDPSPRTPSEEDNMEYGDSYESDQYGLDGGTGGSNQLINEIIKVITTPPSPEELNMTAQEKWMEGAKRLEKITSKMTKEMFPFVMQLMPHIQLSADCANAYLKVVQALRDRRAWAFSSKF